MLIDMHLRPSVILIHWTVSQNSLENHDVTTTRGRGLDMSASRTMTLDMGLKKNAYGKYSNRQFSAFLLGK